MKIVNFELKGNSFYSNDDIWIKIIKNKARIGIEKSLLNKIEGISNIELTYLDNQINKGDSIATFTLTYDKVIEVPSPVNGKVVNLNEDLEYDTDIMISDPYDKGWLVEIEVSNNDEFRKLFNPRVNFDVP